ncbi:hypothetical protein TZ03_22915 [Pseudomonas sp. 10-1B]|uniref:hypothetical protein n=1 Tax=Pseudomonas sp. 10-1B TaxID=1546029 RepID=UPI000620085E|nr:hypothetical protein [Pseudomonas sp. 10-1B]KIY38442.1 hypothetical protein TZ03_22915 [Pseudomonas sp. 10-1B]
MLIGPTAVSRNLASALQLAMRVIDQLGVKLVRFIDLAMVAIGPSHEAFSKISIPIVAFTWATAIMSCL